MCYKNQDKLWFVCRLSYRNLLPYMVCIYSVMWSYFWKRLCMEQERFFRWKEMCAFRNVCVSIWMGRLLKVLVYSRKAHCEICAHGPIFGRERYILEGVLHLITNHSLLFSCRKPLWITSRVYDRSTICRCTLCLVLFVHLAFICYGADNDQSTTAKENYWCIL